MEQLILILIVGAISLVKWIMERNAEKEGQQPPSQDDALNPTLGNRPRAEMSEEERVRRFMEALGLPTNGEAAPPPPVPRQEQPTAPITRSEPQAETPQSKPDRPAKRRMETVGHPSSFPVPRPQPKPVEVRRPEPAPEPIFAEPAPVARETTPTVPAFRVTESAPAPVTPMGQSPIGMPEMATYRAPAPSSDLIDFSSPAALRRALVMAEVLGRPKGLA